MNRAAQKRYILVLIFFLLAAASAFSQGFISIGGGLIVDYNLNNGVLQTLNETTVYGFHYRNTSVGACVFLDAKYALLQLGFSSGSIVETEDEAKNNGDMLLKNMGRLTQLEISLLGKYPISFGEISLFFLVGAGYNFVLSGTFPELWYDTKPWSNPGDESQFGLLGGFGVDFIIADLVGFSPDSLYIRFEALFNVRFGSKYMSEIAEYWKELDSSGTYSTAFGMGPRIKFAVGYKF